MGDCKINKKELRRQYLNLRGQLPQDDVTIRSKKIINKLMMLPCYHNANVIMIYIDFRKEVKTKDLISMSLAASKRIVVPITDILSKKLILSELENLEELSPSSYGILEPQKQYFREVDISLIDIILVPGVVFDLQGYRIGYGGGYYDRLLQNISNHTKTIGLAFDFQLTDHLSVESFDKKVDMIITEERIIANEYAR